VCDSDLRMVNHASSSIGHLSVHLYSILPIVGLGGCAQNAEELAACRLEALKLFGSLREIPSETTQQEVEYVADCMRVEGYTRTPGECGTALNAESDEWCWKGTDERRADREGVSVR